MSALSSTLSLTGTLQSAGGGSLAYAPTAITNSNSVAQAYEVTLSNTPLLITLPANTQWFGVQPPANNTVGLHHKWLTGDTGSKVNAAIGMPCVGVDASQLTFYLWADSALTVTVWSA